MLGLPVQKSEPKMPGARWVLKSEVDEKRRVESGGE